MNMVTIKDVARRAKVSTATVSRVLNDHPSIAREARQRVHDAVEELGYRPNAIARSLRTTNTSTLGLVLSDASDPYITDLARAIEEEARSAGYSVVIGNSDGRFEQQEQYVRTLFEHRVDGLLIVPTPGGSPMVREVAGRGDHVVLVDRGISGVDGPLVQVNGTGAVHDLVDHLVSLGHRRIGAIVGAQGTSTGRERHAAFRAALEARGVPYRDELMAFGGMRQETGQAAAAELLDQPEPPSVVFADGNPAGLGAFEEFKARGLDVPADIGLAVFDDLPWFPLLDPPLTAISQPTAELGRAAVRLLLARTRGQQMRPPELRAHLIPRRSCGEPAISGAHSGPMASIAGLISR